MGKLGERLGELELENRAHEMKMCDGFSWVGPSRVDENRIAAQLMSQLAECD